MLVLWQIEIFTFSYFQTGMNRASSIFMIWLGRNQGKTCSFIFSIALAYAPALLQQCAGNAGA